MPDMALAAIQNKADQMTQHLVNQAVKATFFSYTFKTASAVASGGTFSGSLQISADADFLVLYQNFTVYDPTAGDLDLNPTFTVQIQDTGSSTNFFNQETPVDGVFGDGIRPFLLPLPRLIARNSSLTITGTNLASTNAETLYLEFIGMKLYPQ